VSDQRPNEKDGMIIPFPRLAELLSEKAILALQSKQYQQAFQLFKQLAEFDRDNPQAAYGLAVCSVELGRLDRAESLTKEMLERGVGDYFDVLKLHLTVLIYQKKYQAVCDMVEMVLEESKFLPEERRNLKHLGEFAKRRMNEIPLPSHDERDNHGQADLSEALSNKNRDLQWRAFHQARRLKDEEVLPLYTSFFANPNGDPLLKSMMLGDLKERGIQKTVEVEKFGQIVKVHLGEPLFYEGLSEQVLKKIRDVLGSESPSLLDQASGLWGHFILTMYPLPLVADEATTWAAACYTLVHRMNGETVTDARLHQAFGLTLSEVQPALSQLEAVEAPQSSS